jgi:hypothetical protein
MNSAVKGTLIIPVENQVRELDPKLLLAYVAAGIYLSKSMTAASDLMFQIMRKLGHEIVAWDEEALVHLPGS